MPNKFISAVTETAEGTEEKLEIMKVRDKRYSRQWMLTVFIVGKRSIFDVCGSPE